MRILEQAIRVYCANADLTRTVEFYETIQGVHCARRVSIEETGVTAAKVGGFLILAGSEQQLAAARHVQAILYVDPLSDFDRLLAENGGVRLDGPREVTGGRNVTIRHPDGLVVEYFEPRRAG